MALAFDANLGTVTNSASLTTSAAAAASSRVFAFAWWFDTVAVCTGASGGGLGWVVDHQYEATGVTTDHHIGILSADAPSGLASSTSITPTFDTAVDFGPGIAAVSFTGVATGASGYVDTTSAGKTDSNETWTTNDLVTTLSDTLLIGFSVTEGAGAHTPTGPAAEMHEWVVEGTQDGATVYQIVTSAGTYQVGGTWAGTASFQMNIGVAYEAGEPAPPVNPLKPDFARGAFPMIPPTTTAWLPQ